MHTLKLTSHIDNDGHLRLDIPTGLPQGDIDLVLVIDKLSEKKRRYDFSDLAGRLSWRGDAVAVQRAIRDEW